MPHSSFLTCLALLLLMQNGFLLFESGSIRKKNSYNTAMKNFADLILGLVVYLLAIELLASFLPQVFKSLNQAGPKVMVQACFCATALTLASGAVAERLLFKSYLFLVFCSALITYPLIEWAAWNSDGFLRQLGYQDMAGSGVVHLTGGMIALAGSVVTGRRLGVLHLPNDNCRSRKFKRFHLSDPIHICQGTVFLLIGWLGFNVISISGAELSIEETVIRSMMGALGGGVVGLLSSYHHREGYFDIYHTSLGILSGLVAITGSFHLISYWQSFWIGLLGALVCLIFVKLRKSFGVDDPVEAFAVHAGGGSVGVLVPGWFLPDGWKVQILALVFIGFTAYTLTWLFLALYKRITGTLRPAFRDEVRGLNLSEHNAPSLADELAMTIGLNSRRIKESVPARVEPFTQVGLIASQYNRMVRSMEKNFSNQLTQLGKKLSKQFEFESFAHDLKTPLNVLRAEAYILQQASSENPADPHQSAKIIEANCKTLGRMIDKYPGSIHQI